MAIAYGHNTRHPGYDCRWQRNGGTGQGRMDEDFRDEIAQLEARIEALRESIERCRKFSLAARLRSWPAAPAGSLLVMLALVGYTPDTTIAALAAIIIGTVLLGSNSTTWTQVEAALRETEAMRTDLIGRIELRVVGENTKTLH